MESYMNVGNNQVSVQQFPDFVQKWWREDNSFFFKCTKTLLKVTVYSDKVVRFRYAAYGNLNRDFSYSFAHLYQGKVKSLDFLEEEDKYVIITSH